MKHPKMYFRDLGILHFLLGVSFGLWVWGGVLVAVIFSPLIVGFIYYWLYVWGMNSVFFKSNKVKGHKRWSPGKMKSVERKEFAPDINKFNVALAGLQGLIVWLYPPSAVFIVVLNCLHLLIKWPAKVKNTGGGFYFQLVTIVLSGLMITLLPNLEVTRTISAVFLFLALLGTYWNTLRSKKQNNGNGDSSSASVSLMLLPDKIYDLSNWTFFKTMFQPWKIGLALLMVGVSLINPLVGLGLAVAHTGFGLSKAKQYPYGSKQVVLQSVGFISGALMIMFLTRTYAAVGAILIFVSALSIYSFGQSALPVPKKSSEKLPGLQKQWKNLQHSL